MAFVPFQVKAVYEYTSPHEDDLHFPNGQIITVVEEEDEDWYAGEYMDASGVKHEGIFPRNFVEKYTPQAPPRPNRAPRPKKMEEPVAEAAAAFAPAPEPVPVAKAPEPESIPAPAPVEAPEPLQAQAPISIPVAPKPVEAEQIQSPPAPKAAPAQPAAVKSPPPPPAEKPISGSFRDRIAAFNKAAPPPVPYKPGGNGGGSSFIKKPFVAPPPSKNAYIPPPQQAPVAKIYRRDEDPEIAAREQEDRDNAEKAGLAPTSGDGEEEQPKPTSLKERIALLQKQQAEQAARHAESSAAAKKEKPKKPVKKKSESDAPVEGEEVPLEHTKTQESAGGRSIDDSTTEERQLPVRPKSSRGPPPPPPARAETDGNDADMSGAGDETEGQLDTPVDDSDRAAKQIIIGHPPAPPAREADVGDEEDTNEEAQAEEEEEEEEDDIDPEVRRKEEIRARMAKMSGGMGMMGMFGGGMPMPGPPPPKKKKAVEKQHSEDPEEVTSPTAHAPPIPIFPMPGMAKVKSREEEPSRQEDAKIDEPSQAPATLGTITGAHAPEEVADIEDVAPAPPPHTERPAARASVDERREAPPTPGSRPAPPPVPTASRPLPPPLGPLSPTEGSASDDEMSQGGFGAMRTPTGDAPKFPSALPGRDERPTSSKQSEASYFTDATPACPGTPGHARRQSRVPPIPGMTPGAAGTAPQQARAPPPLPLLQPTLSRSSTGDVGARPPTPKAQPKLTDEEEVTEYEGDYDTDIAPTTHHKDALKAAEEDDDDAAPPPPVHAAPPPLPPSAAPRMPPMQMPPPLPSQPPPHHRQSSDMPRAAPPPPPRDLPPPPQLPPAQRSHQDYEDDGEEYDPYNYSSLPKSNPPPPPAPVERMASYSRGDDYSDDIYSATPPRSPPPVGRNPPPPPPRDFPPPPQHMDRSAPPAPPRESRELQSRERELQSRERESASRGRGSIDMRRDGRRSMDMNRLAMEHDFIANDIDLGEPTMWWAQPNGVPPAFHGRRDILHESEEATATKRGGRSQTTKDLYVLFPDYSQTIITVVYDTNNPQEASFEQKHEAPPARLRPDQLEESHERYGRRLHDAVAAKKESVVGDGTPSGLIVELLKPLKDALLPIGTRAYGALVYSNQGNSIVNQHDEIRPGDIVTFRNAKFQGKHGPMHAKYTAELGKGEGHVAIVAEWDGAKKKVRAWEQGRESKKVKMESFKLEDLRSGEVKIWRVMGRAWVGWEGQNS